jgi:hypothetical protein
MQAASVPNPDLVNPLLSAGSTHRQCGLAPGGLSPDPGLEFRGGLSRKANSLIVKPKEQGGVAATSGRMIAGLIVHAADCSIVPSSNGAMRIFVIPAFMYIHK